MKKMIQIVALGFISGVLSMSVMAQTSHSTSHETNSAKQQKIIPAKGVVKLIDLKEKKVTIEHDPIPELKWPAMVMRFTFSNSSTLGKVKVGDKVKFSFIQNGAISVLQKIEPTK